MSLESALDEERREVLALLEGRVGPARPNSTQRASSPTVAKSPARSMLDIGEAPMSPVLRHASIAGQGVGITSPNAPPQRRSMLNPHAPPPPKPAQLAPISSVPRINVEKEYSFDVNPTAPSSGVPKRVTQGGKKLRGIFGSSSTASRSDASRSYLGKNPKGRSQSTGGPKSLLNTNSSGLMTGPNVFVSDNGQLIDMTNAYRRLSDANLLKSGSSLANLPLRKGSDPTRGEVEGPDGAMRLTKDYDEEAVDSSEGSENDSDEEWDSDRGRGRTRDGQELPESEGGPRRPKSLLAAAEDESAWPEQFNVPPLTVSREEHRCELQDSLAPGSGAHWHRHRRQGRVVQEVRHPPAHGVRLDPIRGCDAQRQRRGGAAR
jgi:hypothetical protein